MLLRLTSADGMRYASMATVTAAKKKWKRNCLTLKKKVEVINYAKKNPLANMRDLGEKFQCGKTQIAKILKKQDSLLSMYESNAAGSRVHDTMKFRSSEFMDVNKAVYEWYVLACSKHIYPGGPQLIEKAKEIAERLGKSNFKGSRGWLEKWKLRYNIKQVKICGESGDVHGETIDSWKERLPEILEGYAKEDIWNMDETGVFWQALPDRGFGGKGRQCKGGKKSKQRVTIAFFVSAAGKKEKPIFIWKSENPRCLRRFDKSLLPVHYFSQGKAWMTGEILEAVLTKLNHRMSSSGRSIILLMDNAGCHPDDLAEKFSNIKIVFLPPNTTSMLQPLDLGIIQNFKIHYRHFLLRYVLSKIDECDTATDVVKSVNILMAIRWVAKAWALVEEETICKCFKKAGILTIDMDVVSRGLEEDDDPFSECDLRQEMAILIDKTMPADGRCTLKEYMEGDNELQVCMDKGGDDWEASFFEQLGDEDQQQEGEDEIDEEDEIEMDVEPPPPKVKNFKEAILALEDVNQFLENRGHIRISSMVGSVIDEVAGLKAVSTKQTTIHDFFHE